MPQRLNLDTMSPMGPKRKSVGRTGSVRIVGGRWRGRRINLDPDAEIRPTADRIRETLFNWLAPVISGMRCLDLFAGTGALGLEALSRGAAEAVFVEKNAAATNALEDWLDRVDCRTASVIGGDALGFLNESPTPFDLVFLDPPFGAIDLENLCTLLERSWLAPGAWIYLELGRRTDLPELPPTWGVVREKTAGQVRFALAKRK